MSGRRHLLTAAIVVAAALSFAVPTGAQQVQKGPGTCAPGNAACQCSYRCCGEERCDGDICNQCVIDCVQRRQPTDDRFSALRSRCESLMMRGFKRL